MEAQICINNVLEPVATLYLQQLGKTHFSTRIMPTAAVTVRFFRGFHITVLPWPTRSPDLSLIEHGWDMTSRGLGELLGLIVDLPYVRHIVQVA